MQQLIKQTIPWEIDTRLTRKFGCFKTPRWLNVQKRRRTSHDSVRGQIYYSNQSAWWFSNIGMGQNLWCSNDFLTVGDEALSYTVYSHFDVKTAMKSAVVFGASVRGLIYIEFNPLRIEEMENGREEAWNLFRNFCALNLRACLVDLPKNQIVATGHVSQCGVQLNPVTLW